MTDLNSVEGVDYGMVNEAWCGVDLPTIDMRTAFRRACQLSRAFGVHSAPGYGSMRRSWASTTETRNDQEHGWRSLVHDVSHWVHREKHNNMLKTHSPVHAALELKMAQYVLRKGWIKPKVKAKPTLEEKRAKQLAQAQEGLLRWLAKQRRATTAIRKLRKKEKRLAKLLAA